MVKKIEKNNFEESIERIENLVTKMESDKASLEKSMVWFEEGMKLIKVCQNQLKNTEQRVQKLIKKSNEGFEIKDS
ncbi:MAG: exodeoxyribonuclease VII small subunit [Candidatus Neomarinimicrobiota bacterium]